MVSPFEVTTVMSMPRIGILSAGFRMVRFPWPRAPVDLGQELVGGFGRLLVRAVVHELADRDQLLEFRRCRRSDRRANAW